MTDKEEFISIFNKNIKREGADKLLKWLEATDFFIAPASTKYHLNCAGGLVKHSIHVYKRLYDLCHFEDETDVDNKFRCPSDESIAICGLLHDVCKANFYTTELRNKKNEATGQWEKVPVYTVDDKFPFGHGEKSVFLISKVMNLSTSEVMAIRWHMGGFDDSIKGGAHYMSKAYEEYPLAVLTHLADMQATYLDEVERK